MRRYKHAGELEEYTPGEIVTSKYVSVDNKTINFHGDGYVAEYISLISAKDIKKILQENRYFERNKVLDEKQDEIVEQLWHDIQDLKFKHPPVTTTVEAGQPLLVVSGNPLAIELTSTIVATLVGSMSARGTVAAKIVAAARHVDLAALSNPDDPNSFIYSNQEIIQAINILKERNAAPDLVGKTNDDILRILTSSDLSAKKTFLEQVNPLLQRDSTLSYFGLRRGGDEACAADLACRDAGFNSSANTLANMPHRFAGRLDRPITGTMAHFFILKYTATYKQALADGKGRDFREALGIPEEQYLDIMRRNAAARKPEDEVNIYDYICFCAYIRAMQDLEKAQDGKFPARKIILLIDTTNTLSGMRAAMEAAITMGRNLDGVRLDTSPLKYIADAKKLHTEKCAADPSSAKYLSNTVFFSTDDVSEETAAQITKKAVINDIKTALGVGSIIANTKAALLKRTEISPQEAAQYSYLTQEFSLAQLSKDTPPSADFKPIVAGNPFDSAALPTDLYTQNLVGAGYYIDQILKAKDIQIVSRISASSMFRITKDSDNFLLITGISRVLSTLNNFKFDKDFVDNLKKNTSLNFTDQQYDLLYNIDDIARRNPKGLDLTITPLFDGDLARPGIPLLNIEGNPDHVLLVESFLTSMVGSMSSVATMALKIVNSISDMNYEDLESLDPKKQKNIRTLYGLSGENAKIPEALKSKANIGAKFIYCGLDNQRSLTPFTSYASMMGGFSGTSMSNDDNMPVYVPGVNYKVYQDKTDQEKALVKTVCFDLNDADLNNSIGDFLKFLGSDHNKFTIQLRGNLTVETLQEINKQAQRLAMTCDSHHTLDNLAKFATIEYWVNKPLCAAENKKGFVYKPVGVTLCSKDNKEEPVFQYVIKAAGADGKLNEKASIPGLEQRTLVLKNSQGQPVAQMIIDLKILRDNNVKVTNPQAILADILSCGLLPKIYYAGGDKLSLRDFTLQPGLTAELFFQAATCRNGDLITPPIQKDVASELKEGAKRAQEAYEQRMHQVPVLIEPRLHQILEAILSDPVVAEYTQLPPKFRPRG